MAHNRELRQRQIFRTTSKTSRKENLNFAEIIGDEETIQDKKESYCAIDKPRIRKFVAEHDLTRRYDREKNLYVVNTEVVRVSLLLDLSKSLNCSFAFYSLGVKINERNTQKGGFFNDWK